MDIRLEQLQEVITPLLDWYVRCKRDLPWRHDPTPYRVWVSEIMLQQTRVDPVIPYYLRFMEALPDVASLAAAPQDQLMKLWEGLGYYSRAANLQKAAQEIVRQGSFPTDYDSWQALPGIGAYTAGAICSIALGLPTPAVDGNVLRVLSRILCSEQDIALPATKKAFHDALSAVYPAGRCSDFTQGLMELGAIVCLPNGEPKCDVCPVRELCQARSREMIDRIPLKTGKKARKAADKTVLLVRHGDRIALNRRPAKGLLANLWEFPNLDGKQTQAEVLRNLSALQPMSIRPLPDSTHIFTHIEWHMCGFEVSVGAESDGFTWASIDEVLREKAIPSAFRCYTDYLRNLRYEVMEQ